MRENSKFYKKFEKKHVEVIFGVFLCLFSIFAVLNFGFVSTALTYAAAFLLGNYYFLIYLVIFLYGIKLIFRHKFSVFKRNFILLGISLIFVSVIIISSLYTVNNGLSGRELTLANFSSTFQSSIKYNGRLPVEVFNNFIGGGYLGFFLCALFNSIFTSYIGTIVICCIFMLCGLFFTLYKPFKELFIYFKAPKMSKEKTLTDPIVPENIDAIEDNNVQSASISEEPKPIEIPNDSIVNDTIQSKTFADPEPKKFVETVTPTPIQVHEPHVIVVPEPTVAPKEERKVEVNEEQKDIHPFPTQAFHFSSGETVIFRRDGNGLSNASSMIKDDVSEKSNNDALSIKPTPVIEQTEGAHENKVSQSSIFDDVDKDQKEDDPFGNFTNSETIKPETKVEPEVIKEETPLINPKTVEIKTESNTVLTPKINVNKTSSQNNDSVLTSKEDEIKDIASTFSDVYANDNYDNYYVPADELLIGGTNSQEVIEANRVRAQEMMNKINEFFASTKVSAQVVSFVMGPAVTRFNVSIDISISASTVEKKMEDLARVLNGANIHFQSIVPGQNTSAIEVSNQKPTTVYYKDVYDEIGHKKDSHPDLRIPFGKNLEGKLISATINSCIHLLVCGTSGSGKSVFEHQTLITLLINNSPADLRLILIDPKQVELTKYQELPHLICPPITSPGMAVVALKKLVDLMEQRYSLFRQVGVNNFFDYNKYAIAHNLKKLPYIVCLIDEYADLVSSAADVGASLVRVAQKARASGMSLIVTTQRPSVDVIDGTIKSNLGVRVSFRTVSGSNSRIILDSEGAEYLLGKGDMYVLNPDFGVNLVRLQSSYISTDEIGNVCDYIRKLYPASYNDAFLHLDTVQNFDGVGGALQNQPTQHDDLYDTIKNIAFESEYISQARLVRDFNIGYSRAGKIIRDLSNDGILAQNAEATKGNKVLIHSQPELDDKNADALADDENKGL